LAVVRIVAQGHTNRETANQLFLSPDTVNTHLRHAFAKLGIRSRVELARVAIEHETSKTFLVSPRRGCCSRTGAATRVQPATRTRRAQPPRGPPTRRRTAVPTIMTSAAGSRVLTSLATRKSSLPSGPCFANSGTVTDWPYASSIHNLRVRPTPPSLGCGHGYPGRRPLRDLSSFREVVRGLGR
jgi:DNA-binding CsgD family transcriptional regulator